MFPSTMTVWQGYRVTFDVKVFGKPSPTYAWYHEGNSIESDHAHEIHEDGSLVILSAEIQHQGTYRFLAINSSGRVDQQVILNVVKPRNITTCDAKRGPISLIKFGEFVAENHADSNKGFHSQFSVSSTVFREIYKNAINCYHQCDYPATLFQHKHTSLLV